MTNSETKIPAEVLEDWYAILMRPGMNVLATRLTGELSGLRAKLDNEEVTDNYSKVCVVRGEMKGIKKVIQFVKSEFDRAAKGDTPEKESK